VRRRIAPDHRCKWLIPFVDDATPDLQKFMVLVPANRTPLDEFTVILNWPNAMKKQ
jgi:hypothetical protein